jgi:hypothetical protein
VTHEEEVAAYAQNNPFTRRYDWKRHFKIVFRAFLVSFRRDILSVQDKKIFTTIARTFLSKIEFTNPLHFWKWK